MRTRNRAKRNKKVRASISRRSNRDVAQEPKARTPATPRDSTKRKLQVDYPTVLVISDDVEFSRSITARWQMERHVPTFTLLSGDLWPRSIDNFAVAIVGPLRRELLSVVLEPLHSTQ